MHVLKILAAVAVVSLFTTPLFADEITELRCGTSNVERGDSDVEVLEKCGEPTIKDGEEWVYDWGETEPLKIVHFVNGVVRYMEEKERL